MYLRDNSSFFTGTSLLVIFSSLMYLCIIAMIVVGFVFLVKFLRAGTKAFNLYVQNNAQTNERKQQQP
ncbi:hypothetical protein [Ruminiclostridium cellobioparum]|uniref:Oxaloacetate decarboxylase, gamma chain n=1 Tax=Ruminiclostridium cellobioparum subsp. termitidis CT1112 TaxID=1195236 RepID=S0FV82_RUMCE|nr:hypothetical protein [Ruminiclostridium cellobioparum]EMS73079.1 hypothetical protein CTER_0989 [Ruminiclostridium cellobioparum subsp. termitidis CT1112]